MASLLALAALVCVHPPEMADYAVGVFGGRGSQPEQGARERTDCVHSGRIVVGSPCFRMLWRCVVRKWILNE